MDIGDAGHHSDGGVFSSSAFGQAIESESLAIPPPRGLPGTSTVVPFVLVGGEAFPLRTNLMQPFPGRYLPESEAVFNYRLSRARRIIENSFGILAARWRIFRWPIIATPEYVVLFTKAAIALHNYLRVKESTVYCPPGFVDADDGTGNLLEGEWRAQTSDDTGMRRIGRVGGTNQLLNRGRHTVTISSVHMEKLPGSTTMSIVKELNNNIFNCPSNLL